MEERNLVFSGSNQKQLCVDCGGEPTRRAVYPRYTVGDLVCNTDAERRRRLAGASITSIPPKVRIVPTDD